MTAPNSSSAYSRSKNSMKFYYSAPASPRRALFKAGDGHLHGSTFDEFEFKTSKRFRNHLLPSEVIESPRGHDRRDSLPPMAFADDLFLNGLVIPLKPPPGLHWESEFPSFSHTSTLSSPKSTRTVCRIPFARKSSWKDDFDPFMVALERVKEEKRGRNSHHRRSRSYSPFRAMSRSSSSVTTGEHSQDLLIEPLPAPTFSRPLDFKGSAYARWVRDQARHGLSPKSPRGILFRQRVRPLNDSDKPSSPAAKHVVKKRGNAHASKVQKVKAILVRYASFGRGNSGNKQTKTSTESHSFSYFSREI